MATKVNASRLRWMLLLAICTTVVLNLRSLYVLTTVQTNDKHGPASTHQSAWMMNDFTRRHTASNAWRRLQENAREARSLCHTMENNSTRRLWPFVQNSLRSDVMPTCYEPPSTACDVTSYSILVTSQANDVRTLFVNLLHWLTYPHVDRIHVVLLANVTLDTPKDEYGARLWAWHVDPHHVVSLHWDNLWTLLKQVNSPALLFVDGDLPWNGNAAGSLAGFQLWQQHASSLVATSGWRIVSHHTNTQRLHGRVLVCPPLQLVKTHNHMYHVPHLSGLFVHSAHLSCLRQDWGHSVDPQAELQAQLQAELSVWLSLVAKGRFWYSPHLHRTRRIQAFAAFQRTTNQSNHAGASAVMDVLQYFGSLSLEEPTTLQEKQPQSVSVC